jgi:hypothetical protein
VAGHAIDYHYFNRSAKGQVLQAVIGYHEIDLGFLQ